MSAIVTLPASLQARLTALRWRIRLLRAVAGSALLAIVLGCLAAAAVLLDCWLDLPALGRQIIIATWLFVGLAGLLRGMVIPLCRRIDAAALAVVVEEKYPDLNERLSTAVEIAGVSSEGHGSPVLIALLLEETAAQSEALDFRAAVSARRAAVLASFAAIVVVLIAVSALYWPKRYSEWAQRFFVPWGAAVEAPTDIAAAPSEPAIVPVELAADSPTVTVTPPDYARSIKEVQTLHGLADLAALQHSEIRFDFRFTRSAKAAYLEVSGEKAVRYPLALSADRQAASLAIYVIADVKYRLILEAEHNTRTELPGGMIHVQLDQPPSVRRFAGKTELRSVLPYERLPFEIEAADDIGVAAIELEYRINEGEAVRQSLELHGGNTPSAAARHVLELAGKVQENDRFSYRFRVSDNLPKEFTGPHIVFYPPDRWLTLQIARQGDPLQQQEILSQRDEINRRLQAIRESLLQEKRDVERVKQEMGRRESVLIDPLDSIKPLQRQNQANEKALHEAAQLADSSPALQPVAETARDVNEREMHNGEQALEQAARQASPEGRARQFSTVEEQLTSAVRRLEELKRTNDRLAEERLHQAKLEMLAQREKLLAERAAELTGKHPVLDPKGRELVEKLKREQAETMGELDRLSQQSEPLKQSLHRARQEEAQRLAEQARQLAKTQRDLARAKEQTKRQRTRDRQRGIQQETGELNRQLQRLAQEARSSGPMQLALQRAANDSHAAYQTMQQARDQGQRGEATVEKQTQELAAQLLDQAARAASEAARIRLAAKSGTGNPKAGEAVTKASRDMTDAQGQLHRGQPVQAQSAMQHAADALALAAKQMAANSTRQPGMPGKQIGLGRQAGGLPDLSAYGVDKATYADKPWGELPGELRTKIIQDIKARYGEDYARMIKSYFEQIANTKR